MAVMLLMEGGTKSINAKECFTLISTVIVNLGIHNVLNLKNYKVSCNLR